MKKFQKLALGLMVGAMAIGFSAFTNAKVVSKSKGTTYYYYTNDGTNYNYAGTSAPADNCSGSSSAYCIVQTTTSGLPTQFSNTNPDHYSITRSEDSSLAKWTD